MADESFVAFEEQGIDLKKWMTLFLRNWVFFFICLLLAFTIALLFLMFSPKQYELATNILVNKENSPLDKAQFFNSAFYSDPYQLENEKGILGSKSVTRNALKDLNFQVGYFTRQRFSMAELYGETPFTIEPDTAHLQPLGVVFNLKFIGDSLMAITAASKEVILYDFNSDDTKGSLPEFHFEDTVHFGEITGNSYCRFTIFPGFDYLSRHNLNKDFSFTFYSSGQLISIFRNFKIENDRGSSILRVSFRYPNPRKAADFLNRLTAEYLNRGVERDNLIAAATIHFIDEQLVGLVDSLELSGERLQDFRSSKKVMDIGFQAEKVYTKLETLEAQKARLMVKKRYFNYLIQNLQSKSDVSDLIAPTSLEINDPVLNSLNLELANLYTERAELSFNSIKDNPYLKSLESKIDDTRRKLQDAARNILDATDIAIEETEEQIWAAEQTMDRLPRDQQKLLNIERKFKLNDELYTYLLTRRSEMEIFQASNIPENEILDVAEAQDAQLVSPNARLNMVIALILGLFFPGAVLYFRETMNTRIRSREDIQKLTDHPIVGQVIDSKNGEYPAVLKDPNSVLTESYRTLRTNLQFVLNESVSNAILVTSAIQGEGKSFTALNMASVYALYGRRTILVDFDLRKSTLKDNLSVRKNTGLSNYLSRNCTFEEIIHRDDALNFDLILAGPVPPNPSELIASELTGELIGKLKKSYDIIMIDSPPLGVVSDALMLYPHCEITLLVARFDYTSSEVFANLMSDLKTRNIGKVNIVLNDVIPAHSGYGYGYVYGYGAKGKKKGSKL